MTDQALTADADRPMKPAMLRGWKRRCPACGDGKLFQGYLKVRDVCPSCGQELYHQRADDGPAYVTIMIVGHLMAPIMLFAFVAYRPDPWVMSSAFAVGCVALALYLLPRIKGTFVGIQWAKRMHGFGVGSPGV